jgi:hypothetical protein
LFFQNEHPSRAFAVRAAHPERSARSSALMTLLRGLKDQHKSFAAADYAIIRRVISDLLCDGRARLRAQRLQIDLILASAIAGSAGLGPVVVRW